MDVFDHMRKVDQAGQKEQQQLSFQERIVKQILRRANIQLDVGRRKAEAAEKFGFNDLGFQWFNEEYPRYPVILLSQKMRYTHQTTLADLYGRSRFKQLGWWKEYEDQVAAAGIDLHQQRVVLFFNLPHAKDAFLMSLHNMPIQVQPGLMDAESRQDEPWPRTTFPMGKTGVVAVLESFDSFLQTVGNEWADT